ncbi:peptidylprolyl isomerase [Nitrogeniibacter mangrovi]|uniref:peptidylprolyl isomerase n=1 Tax=Nitrogeniibacter mangrovi TaxID=2016596 RepID=A0A6C1B3F3_9RHOO|nr:peptidylprolyl isomerase [Nitrogeniibacter mangrovi]QID17519.1 peptidylprolyl isomerase [Nitrogeniibacter mangrovi]
MKLFSKTLIAMLIAGFAAQGAMAADTVAKVNGKAIPQAFADALMAEQTAKGAPDSKELRDAVREELVRREILFQAAKKAGVDKKPEVQTQVELARQAVILRAYLQDFVKKNEVTDADVRKAYDDMKARLGDTEYNVSHILVDDEAKARALIAKIKGGAKFEDIAKAESTDPGSKEKGGELGWSSPGMYVPAFSEAMTKLKKGEMTSEPVKSNFGYHIIRVNDTRKLDAPEFEKIEPQIKQRLQTQRLENHIMELRKAAKVE